MKKLYIITGANGHLGNTIIRILSSQQVEIRGLILSSEHCQDTGLIHYIKGDIRDKDSLRPLFADIKDTLVYVIHTAGMIDISEQVSPLLYDVNVNGTKNILSLCKEYHVQRLVHVSSVHAIPEKNKTSVLSEVDSFQAETVYGGYAKTKAEATQAVLDAAKVGLDAVVIQPSGIIGPYDRSGNYLVQMITDYISGRLPACVKGGYDFVDVRDVAHGCLLAAKKGRTGECYILSNRHYDIKDVLNMVRSNTGGKRLPLLPMWMAKACAPMMQWYSSLKKERPLYTAYSLYTLQCNDKFSHNKATKELGYSPRDLRRTIRDTVLWYQGISRTPDHSLLK